MDDKANLILKPSSVRHNNYRSVLLTIKELGSCTASHITKRLDLSKTAVSKIIVRLVELGYIVPTGKGSSSIAGGKRPDIYEIASDVRFTCTVAFYNKSTIVELRNFLGEQTHRNGYEYPKSCRTPKDIMEFCHSKITETLEICGISSKRLCGVIIISDKDNFIETNGIFSEIYFNQGSKDNIQALLANALNIRELVYMENSKDMRGYAELRFDRNRRFRTLVVISVLRQSLTGCVIQKGRVLHGSNDLMGSVAHITTDYTLSRQCSCGRRGCMASVSLQEAILEEVSREIEGGGDSSLAVPYHEGQLRMKDIIDAVLDGDELAVRHMNFVLDNYIHLFYTIQLTLNPDEIILQIGPYSRGYHYNELNKRFNALNLPQSDKPLKISTSEIDPMEAAFIGSADYCIDAYLNQPFCFEPMT